MSREVREKMAHGVMWMVLFKLTERSLGFISTLILVRLLSPADFGITAMAVSFIAMAETFTAFGFDVNLIQNQNATEEHYHTAWTCNVLLGLSITVMMLAAAPLVASFYKHPELFWVVCALALGPLISACENIGVVAFRKDMRFKREFAFQLSRKIIGFLVVVPLAYILRSYWALVIGILVSKLTGTTISYLLHPFRPRYSLTQMRGLLGFSKWMLLLNVLGFLKESMSNFVLGRLLGAAPLGVYNVSYEITSMPTTELSAPINRALVPGFARIAHDPESTRTTYGTAMGMLALVAVPAATGIFAMAPYIVPVLLGQKWLAGVPVMEILAFSGALGLFHSSIGAALIATGHPDRVTKTTGVFVAMLMGLLALLVPGHGLRGAAYAMLTTSILTTPMFLYQAWRGIGVPATVFLAAAARPVLAALAMAALLRYCLPEWTPAMSQPIAIGWTVGGIALGIVAYALGILLLWLAARRPAGAERALAEWLRQRLRRRR
jgi:O-antigen/teichoic acid export membrane protein